MPESPPTKAELRRAMRRRLAAVAPAAAAAAAARVADRVLALPELASASRVLCCLSFGHELDTRGLVERLLDDEIEVVVPRCVPGTRQLTLHVYPCELEPLSFGLEQPREGTPAVLPAEVDLALLVGLAFDRHGYRLGHGGGYFDRFLAAQSMPAIGLAYEAQLVDRLLVEDHDIPMARVITEA